MEVSLVERLSEAALWGTGLDKWVKLFLASQCGLWGSKTLSEARALTASPRLPAFARAMALLAGSNDPYLRMMFGLSHRALNCPDLNRVINSRVLEVAVLPLRLLGATSLGRRRRPSKAPGLQFRAS